MMTGMVVGLVGEEGGEVVLVVVIVVEGGLVDQGVGSEGVAGGEGEVQGGLQVEGREERRQST